jgi:hypothetical protein
LYFHSSGVEVEEAVAFLFLITSYDDEANSVMYGKSG